MNINKNKIDFQSVYNDATILSTRVFKAGYIVRKELIKSFRDSEPLEMSVAYNHKGDYIGNPKEAYYLCVKRGILPEPIDGSQICSIGYCKKDRKWYGWSHRALFGFKTGSKVKIGDCGFTPSNREEFIEAYREFWTDKDHVNEKLVVTKNKVKLTYDGYRQQDGTINYNVCLCEGDAIPKTFTGRGCWTARSQADAKQMAIDFAKGVS
jgi:hypothetical protein